MPIYLTKVDISLDKFDAAASGKFNIGHIKFNEDGTDVCRTNRRKTFEFLNNDTISAEKSLAVKDAFCKAFSNEGLSAKSLADIRLRLGLEGGVMHAIRERNFKPLTAAQVRAIIDDYADEVNAIRAARHDPDRLRKSSEIYAGVDRREMENRKTVREATNARSEAKMNIQASSAANRALELVDIVTDGLKPPREHIDGTLHEEPEGPIWPKGQLDMLATELAANITSDNVLRKTGETLDVTTANLTLVRGASGTLLARVVLEDGNVFAVDTGLTKYEFALWAQKKTGFNLGVQREDKTIRPPTFDTNPQKVVSGIQKAFMIATEREELDKIKDEMLKNAPAELRGRKLTAEDRERYAYDKARDAVVDKYIPPLVAALNKARPKDARNVELVNKVRSVIRGAQSIGVDENGLKILNTHMNRRKLIEEISAVIKKKRVDAPEMAAGLEGIEDDEIEGNLNIGDYE